MVKSGIKHIGFVLLMLIAIIAMSIFIYNLELYRLVGFLHGELKMSGMEKERIQPDRGDRPNVSAEAEKQTFVLHPHIQGSNHLNDPYLLLRIPNVYFKNLNSNEPVDTFGVNLFIDYPDMTRANLRADGKFSADTIILSIQYNGIAESARPERARQSLYSQIKSGHDIQIKSPPEKGYSEEYIKDNRSLHQTRTSYIKINEKNICEEFVTVIYNEGVPSVRVDLLFPTQQNLELGYNFDFSNWHNRDNIKHAVLELVSRIYKGELPAVKN